MGTEGASQRLVVGRVGRARGLRGEVTVALTTDRPERAEPGAVLYAGDRRLVIETVRSHANRLIVRFAGVGDRDAAEELRGQVLHADPLPQDDDDVLWVHELIGADVFDTAGERLGTIDSVEANPAHDILVLDGGGLIPAVFVVEHSPGRVVIDPPEGLFDT